MKCITGEGFHPATPNLLIHYFIYGQLKEISHYSLATANADGRTAWDLFHITLLFKPDP